MSKQTNLSPLGAATRRCLLFQCFAIGSWMMLLLVKFGLDFPFSSEIGTIAIFITAAFVVAAMVAIEVWFHKLPQLQPDTKSVRDSAEIAQHTYLVLTTLACIAVLLLLMAAVLILFFHKKTSDPPAERYFTNWPMYVLSLSWLGHLSYLIFDVVNLHLWKKLQRSAEETSES